MPPNSDLKPNMPQIRFLFLALLVLGLSATYAFRAGGPVTAEDALVAAAAQGPSILDPPLKLTSHATRLFVNTARSIEPRSELFPLVHQVAALFLAVAAACSGVVASRGAGTSAGRGVAVAAGIAVGAGVLFGKVTGFSGIAASGVSTVLALLAGSAWAWISPRPFPLLGGLLFGAAAAEHPFVWFAAPGFLAMALGVCIRTPAEEESRVFRRAFLGVALGFAAFLGWGQSIPSPEPLLQLASPLTWGSQVVALARAIYGSVGPIGLLAAIAGGFALHGGESRFVRPFLAVHATCVLASIFVTSRDLSVLHALAAWSFLFFWVPFFSKVAQRFSKSSPSFLATPAGLLMLAFVLGGALFAQNRSLLDRRGEPNDAWVRDSFAKLTDNGVLLTANPAHWALRCDGERPDLDVIYVDRPESLKLQRSTLGLFAPELPAKGKAGVGFFQELIQMNLPHRPVFFDPSLFFRAELRTSILGERWQANPFGLAYKIAPRGQRPTDNESQASAILWNSYEVQSKAPESPLRDGLDGAAFYARSLLQCAALSQEYRLRRDAERDYLLALSLPAVNPNLARFGLARVYFDRQDFEEVIRTVDGKIDPQREGGWLPLKVLATAYLRLGDPENAKRVLYQAIELCPLQNTAELQSLQSLLEGAKQGRVLPPRSPDQDLFLDEREK